MLHYLSLLRDWVEERRDWANHEAASRDIPMAMPIDLPKVRDFEFYKNVSIGSVIMTYNGMVQLRQYYDTLFSQHEGERTWGSEVAIRGQLACVFRGYRILTEAFLLPEQIEFQVAKQQQFIRQTRHNMLRQLGASEDFIQNLDGDEDSGLDFDSLFNGEQPSGPE